jgi:hypothetical protein
VIKIIIIDSCISVAIEVNVLLNVVLFLCDRLVCQVFLTFTSTTPIGSLSQRTVFGSFVFFDRIPDCICCYCATSRFWNALHFGGHPSSSCPLILILYKSQGLEAERFNIRSNDLLFNHSKIPFFLHSAIVLVLLLGVE